MQTLHNLYLKVTECVHLSSLYIQEYGHCPIKETDFYTHKDNYSSLYHLLFSVYL